MVAGITLAELAFVALALGASLAAVAAAAYVGVRLARRDSRRAGGEEG